jgi:predicted SPOUT superfamily RNA methylase MTH1
MTVSVLVPSSLVRDAPDKRAATRKLGTVARAAAVFRIDRLVVFPDREGERRWGGGFVETVLRYAATPPELRKEVFGERDELESAGVLPPLRLPPRTGSESNGSGSSRQGIVTAVDSVDGSGRATAGESVRVACGLGEPVSLVVPDGTAVETGDAVCVRVASHDPLRARLVAVVDRFRVDSEPLDDALDRPDAGLRVATSRHGTPLRVSGLGGLTDRVEADVATVAFGAPERGLPAIRGVDTDAVGADAAGFDRWIDAIPDQGSEVVRTEEAVIAVLALLSLRR